jgi:dipeptidase E
MVLTLSTMASLNLINNMKFYLSSYKLGNELDKLKELLPSENKKTAYISNALDFSDDLERRKKSEQSDIEQLEELGLDIEIVDLRDYFNKQGELEERMSEFGVIWVRGGNLFVLRQAMKLSGFDEILKKLVKKDNILYGGYSAGVCVLSTTLKGMNLVDDPNIKPYGDQSEIAWDGLGILNYSVIPHYQSDHAEAESAKKAVEYMIENKMLFKALKDGEVIIVE